jgi:type IV pilus assembly protein PilN
MSTVSRLLDSQDLLRQRRLERGLPAEPPQLASARRLLLIGTGLGTGLLALVLLSWAFLAFRDQRVSAEISRMSGVPGQLLSMETALRNGQGKLTQQTKSNTILVSGLVAVSSGSALVTQLAQLTPQGVQITEATVTGSTLTLKGLANDPGAFARVNALSLLLAYAPLFQPDVKVVKLLRSDASAPAKGQATVPPVTWELAATLKPLKPAEQLGVLQRLGADGMIARLKDLARTGVLP